jgi:hypothetical protein
MMTTIGSLVPAVPMIVVDPNPVVVEACPAADPNPVVVAVYLAAGPILAVAEAGYRAVPIPAAVAYPRPA